jgi:hypothetical protein
MPISLPDSTKFDADSDKISTSRAELKKISDAVNTLATEWNNQGDTFGGAGANLVAGDGIVITQPDSAGSSTISVNLQSETIDGTTHLAFTTDPDQTKTIHIVNAGTLVSDSAGDYHEIYMNVDNLLSSPPGTIHYFILSCTGAPDIIPAIKPHINSKRTINEFDVYNGWEFRENTDTGVVRVTVLSSTKIMVENEGILGGWEISIERES